MKTNLVNGQNGVATSAKEMFKNKFEGSMYVDQTSFTMDEIGSWTSEQKEGLLNKVRRMHMKNTTSKEFVYNNIKFNFNWGVVFTTGERIFQIYATIKTNGKYNYGSIIAFRKFPNYYGISDVFNTLMCDLVADMFEVADIAKAEWDRGYCEGFNSPDALIGFENDEEDDIIEDDYTIREYYKFHKGDYCNWTDEPINCYVDDYMSLGDAEVFKNLVKKLEDCSFYIKEDDDGNLYVSGNESFCDTYFDDDTPMIEVYVTLMHKMNDEIIRIENKTEKEIEKETKYKVLDAFEITDALDEDYNLEFLRNRMPTIPIDLIKQGVDEYLNDEYEYRRYSGTGRFECVFEKFADKVWENVWALVLDNDLSDEFIEFDTRNYMEFNDRLYYMIDSENLSGLFIHNDNVCQNFDDDVPMV